MDNSSCDREFVLERYKYVLDQKRELNRTTFAVVAIYQAGLALVAGAHLSVRSALAKGELSVGDGKALQQGASWLLVAVTVFAMVIVISGIAAWLNCRRDEAGIEAAFLGGARPLPSWKSALFWYETYIVLAMGFITGGYFIWLLH